MSAYDAKMNSVLSSLEASIPMMEQGSHAEALNTALIAVRQLCEVCVEQEKEIINLAERVRRLERKINV